MSMDEDVAVVEPRPIGGWLLLLGIGVCLNPFRVMFETYTIYAPLFRDGVFSLLFDPAGGAYQPGLAAFLLGELAVNIIMICGWSLVLYGFLTRKRFFPKLYIIFMLGNLAVLILDGIIGAYVLDVPFTGPNGAFDAVTLQALMQSGVAAAIWVPYMLISVRVKETFLFNRDGSLAGQDGLQEVFR